MEHTSFLCSQMQPSPSSLNLNLNLKFKHGQPGVSLFFVVHLRSRQTTLTSTRQVLETGFLSFNGVSFNTPKIAPSNNNCLAASFSEFLPFLSFSLIVSHILVFFLFLFFNIFPPILRHFELLLPSRGFLTMNCKLLGISSLAGSRVSKFLYPMGSRLHHCSSRFRILKTCSYVKTCLLTECGSTHGESRLGGVACQDVRLYPRIGDDSRI